MRFRTHTDDRPTRNVHAPLIDVVFLLLIFFMLTLKIVPPEGGFTADMPREPGRAVPDVPRVVPVTLDVRLVATENGSLSRLQVGTTDLGSDATAFDRLRQLIVEFGPEARRDLRVTLHADPRLHYEHTLHALSAVGQYRNPATGNVEQLVEHVNLAG